MLFRSALSRGLIGVEVPRAVRAKNYEEYDGTQYPIAYLDKFAQAVNIMGINSQHMANLLPTCLKGNALKWLRNKVPGSINSWGDFTRGLVQAFATKKDQGTQQEEFKTIRQYPNERLRDFVKRFRTMVNTTPGLTDKDIISTFANGVRNHN